MSTKKWWEKARERADELKIGYPQIAEELSVSPGAVGHYLNGRRKPTPEALGKIARKLRMSVSELIEDDPDFARDSEERKVLDLWRLLHRDADKSAVLRMIEAIAKSNPE